MSSVARLLVVFLRGQVAFDRAECRSLLHDLYDTICDRPERLRQHTSRLSLWRVYALSAQYSEYWILEQAQLVINTPTGALSSSLASFTRYAALPTKATKAVIAVCVGSFTQPRQDLTSLWCHHAELVHEARAVRSRDVYC